MLPRRQTIGGIVVETRQRRTGYGWTTTVNGTDVAYSVTEHWARDAHVVSYRAVEAATYNWGPVQRPYNRKHLIDRDVVAEIAATAGRPDTVEPGPGTPTHEPHADDGSNE